MGLMGASGLSARKIIDLIYPVGSIYTSANNVSPQSLFGGSWEQIQGRFMLTSGNGYNLGATGGEATHTLTVNEMPAHSHTPNGGGQFATNGTGPSAGFGSGPYWFMQSNTSTVGGGAAHNNMPPYIVVNAWKRTA